METRKTAKAAIHGRSVYNLHRPLTAKQPAQIHPGPLRGGGEEQSNYILKQQSEASPACKQTSSTHTNTDRLGKTFAQYFPKSCGASRLRPVCCLWHTVIYTVSDLKPQRVKNDVKQFVFQLLIQMLLRNEGDVQKC